MKSLLTAIAMILSVSLHAADTTTATSTEATPAAPKNPLLPGMKSEQETVEAEILKVYQMDEKGAQFRAYVVKFKDTEVVVSDPLGMTNRKVGEKITFMAIRMSMPLQGKTINVMQFMLMDMGAFMPK